MAKQTELFLKPPRSRTRMAHVVDAGVGPCVGQGRIALFACRCGWQSGWISVASVSAAKRGIPCKTCNKDNQ